MGYAFERQGKAGQVRYTGVYRDLKGRLRSAGTYSTRKKAEDEARIAERAASEGRMPDRKRGRQTLRHYVVEEWFPNHVIEATTRENYTYLLNKYILPELGGMRIIEILPLDVREWILRLQRVHGLNPPTIRLCKAVLDGAFTTALNDRIVFLHPGQGVKVPPAAKKTKRIITVQQFNTIYDALGDDIMRLLVETDIESGLRWGELTELRPKDLDLATGMLTISRVVVHLKAKDRPDGVDFLVKEYPKDKEWRHVKLAPAILAKLKDHIVRNGLGPDDLLFQMPDGARPRRRTRPAELPDPDTLGLTEPNDKGRQYRHGTASAYTAGRCRCQHCRDAMSAYRAARRADGKDAPRTPRTVATDGHIGNDWFRANIWTKALTAAGIGFRVTPHGLRHAHASWLLAGGADLLVVKERLGHGSITTTEQYLHTLPGAQDAALAALDAVRGEARTVPPADSEAPQAESPTDTAAELAALRQMLAEIKGTLERADDAQSA